MTVLDGLVGQDLLGGQDPLEMTVMLLVQPEVLEMTVLDGQDLRVGQDLPEVLELVILARPDPLEVPVMLLAQLAVQEIMVLVGQVRRDLQEVLE